MPVDINFNIKPEDKDSGAERAPKLSIADMALTDRDYVGVTYDRIKYDIVLDWDDLGPKTGTDAKVFQAKHDDAKVTIWFSDGRNEVLYFKKGSKFLKWSNSIAYLSRDTLAGEVGIAKLPSD